MTEDGFYVTGDVFRRDRTGFYYFVGRADDMFVSGGENVYPGEVEATAGAPSGYPPGGGRAGRRRAEIPEAGGVCRAAPGRGAERGGNQGNSRWPTLRPTCIRAGCGFSPEMPLAGTNKIDRRALAERAAELLSSIIVRELAARVVRPSRRRFAAPQDEVFS